MDPYVTILPQPYVSSKGSGGSQDGVSIPLEEALKSTFKTDAHLVCYVTGKPGSAQYRLKKTDVTDETRLLVWCVDLDNPGHSEWTPELMAAFRTNLAASALAASAGVYTTKRGARLVFIPSRSMSPREHERSLAAILSKLIEEGLEPDRACKDWTRLFRLPRVRRDGQQTVPAFEDFSHMTPLDVDAILEALPAEAPLLPPRKRQVSDKKYSVAPMMAASIVSASAMFFNMVPTEGDAGRREQTVAAVMESTQAHKVDEWAPRMVGTVADALRATESFTNWHEVALAMAGALSSIVDHRLVPGLVDAIFFATGRDSRQNDRRMAALSTINRVRLGLPCTGMGTLRRLAPAVAFALQSFGAELDVVPEAPPVAPARAASEKIKELITNVGDGGVVIAAPCGVGKTHAAIEVAIERATADRKLDTKTAFSVPTHKLAAQVAEDVAAKGHKYLRILSPLRFEGEDACKFKDQLLHLSRGGQSIRREFCEGRGKRPCEFKQTCVARRGYVGDLDAKIIIGPHASLPQIVASCGKTGLLIIDEPPPLVLTHAFKVVELFDTRQALGYFDADYAERARPVLDAMLNSMSDGTPVDYAAARAAFAGIDCLAPPLTKPTLSMCLNTPGVAARVGRASDVLRILQSACTMEKGSLEFLPMRDHCPEPIILATYEDKRYKDALERDGRNVILDAGADVRVPEMKAMVASPPEVQRAGAEVSCKVERHMLHSLKLSRTHACYGGRKVFVNAFGFAMAKLDIDHENAKIGVITFKSLHDNDWFRTSIRSLAPNTTFGYYGGLRGLNSMEDVDVLIMLGTPIPNLDAARAAASAVGTDPDKLIEKMTRDELEQAEGRARVFHRTKPVKIIVCAGILPANWTTKTPEKVFYLEHEGNKEIRKPAQRRVLVQLNSRKWDYPEPVPL